jgi:hypothetical protein
MTTQGSKQNLAELTKIKIETLPLIWRHSACTFREIVLKVKEAVQEVFGLVEFADVYTIGELVEKFNEKSEPFDSSSDFELEDLDTIFTLDFLEVD